MKTLVAISGGPKSLVTAWLLKKQGMQVRGIHFDLFSDEAHRERIHEFEKRLGITIQIIEGGEALQRVFQEEWDRSAEKGFEPDFRGAFFRRLLFPRLIQLRKELGFDRLATGHSVHLQEDPSLQIGRVMLGADIHFHSIVSLLGIPKEEIFRLLAPIGSIPETMLNRLTEETAPKELTGIFEHDWGALWGLFDAKDPTPYKRLYQVISADGVLLGNLQRSSLRIGETFVDPQGGENKRYRILDVKPSEGRAVVQIDSQIRAGEVHFFDGLWFSRGDLGLRVLEVGMLWKARSRPVPIRLMQLEGGAFRATLLEPLSGSDLNVFKGDTVLWCLGSEVLGGAKVLRVK
jgi:hypothetical protein